MKVQNAIIDPDERFFYPLSAQLNAQTREVRWNVNYAAAGRPIQGQVPIDVLTEPVDFHGLVWFCPRKKQTGRCRKIP